MKFVLDISAIADEEIKKLKKSKHLEKRYKAVAKCLRFLAENPKHPGLQTHQYYSIQGPNGEKVFEAYAEQNTPGAYRVFFCYGPRQNEISILSIGPHL